MYDVLMYSCGICMPCMYPHILCNVDVISTLQKRLQDVLLSLVGPSSSFRIGSHLGRDILQASYKPKLLATLVDPVGKYAPLVGKTIITASSRLELCFLQET